MFSQPFRLKVIQEPKGWQSDYKSYERDTDSRGIQSKVNIDLEFFGDGATYLKDVYDVYGINEKVILTKYERDTFSLSEIFKLQYTQTLDFTSYDYDHDKKSVKVKATQGGLYDDIKNRESDEYDLLNKFSADNIDIGYVQTVLFQPKGRDIFIESLLEAGNVNGYRLNSRRYARTRDAVGKTVRTVPMVVVYNSDQEDIFTPMFYQDDYNEVEHSQAYDLGTDQDIKNLFFHEAEGDESVYLDFTIDYKISEIRSRRSYPTNFSVEIFVTDKNKDDD